MSMFKLKPKTDAGILVSIILLGIWILVVLAFWGVVFYVAWHFIKRFW